VTAASDAWEARAACAGLPTDWWFPENKQTARATRVCATCPVVVECLVAAMAHDSEAQVQADTGVWGGCGPRARRFGTAAHLAGGETWEAALTAHLSWLAVVASGVSLRLPKHPWNATGKEQITHGTVGGYNHCTEGKTGGPCPKCKLAKGFDADRRLSRRKLTPKEEAA
jgi:hypothetical protein